MNKLQAIYDRYPDEEFLSADGLEDAIIGVDAESMRLVYSVTKCLNIFVGEGMTWEDASEYFEFNVRGAYVGEKTPIWCDDDL